MPRHPLPQVGPPKVITKIDPQTGGRMEPMEEAVIEVPEEHVGQVVDLMGQRKAQMVDMTAGGCCGTAQQNGRTRGCIAASPTGVAVVEAETTRALR